MLATTATGTRVAARYHQAEKQRRITARAERLNLTVTELHIARLACERRLEGER